MELENPRLSFTRCVFRLEGARWDYVSSCWSFQEELERDDVVHEGRSVCNHLSLSTTQSLSPWSSGKEQDFPFPVKGEQQENFTVNTTDNRPRPERGNRAASHISKVQKLACIFKMILLTYTSVGIPDVFILNQHPSSIFVSNSRIEVYRGCPYSLVWKSCRIAV